MCYLVSKVKPTICMCCGEPIEGMKQFAPHNSNTCLSCASLLDDVQDRTIIQTAIPYEFEPPAHAERAARPEPAEIS
jgi:hypothetical protein